MSAVFDRGRAYVVTGLSRLNRPLRRLAAWLNTFAPRGLYARSLLIIILPMVLLQAVVAVVFMERHYDLVTRRLSDALTNMVAGLVRVYHTYPQDADFQTITSIAARDFRLDIAILRDADLPPPAPKPFFSLVDATIAERVRNKLDRPFWIDTVGDSDQLEIRVKLDDGNVMRIFADRKQAVPSNTHIFIVWMVSTALVLLTVAILFLRNQIRPILSLARAAEAFGMGRQVEDFRPRGAREVRQASVAFLQMRDRIERQIEQRTTMLTSVSHDLRTVLTRFKLQLALLPPEAEVKELEADVAEMQRMLEEYLAFAKGDAAEEPGTVDLQGILDKTIDNGRRWGLKVKLVQPEELPLFTGKPGALERCFSNIVHNASRFAKRLIITATATGRYITLHFDDDGPGIPPEKRSEVFKPFHRLDNARNQDAPGSGLGLAIVRDIVRSHGGEISLEEAPTGGLRVSVRLPLAGQTG